MVNAHAHATVVVAEITRSLANLSALGQLLNCVDPSRWNSLARPSAEGIAGLVLTAHAEVHAAVSEVVDLPPAP